MDYKLDYDDLSKGFKSIKIGTLDKEVIELLKLNRNSCDIILWEDRFKYIDKHKEDFETEEAFKAHIEEIPNIIKSPDYIAKHPKKNSIEYIKKIDELMLVAIRIKQKGNLAFRSAYPLTNDQLQRYLESGTAFKVNK
ncbi:PBECR3 domain-containing polyvalent protein [Clostridium sp. ZS2-4]|uniref:PBECR3 domain-containing polyvalent protein n=1 Tax=Clostridium sp. ZS2-4 TaxID=2987703 RepID=UPI00227AF9F4|nr:PBECR2 nuclease fold domain-containing protein [Clostridium sp. ZS2-4]MCY6353669.1 PBECR2 nuclease fold domain-containing protein [Clostridium sp. ZS2-4]